MRVFISEENKSVFKIILNKKIFREYGEDISTSPFFIFIILG